MRVLGIESSCDDTAAAVYDSAAGLLSNVVSSQGPIHALYGGVVPELASREHIRAVVPVVEVAVVAVPVSVAAGEATFPPALRNSSSSMTLM